MTDEEEKFEQSVPEEELVVGRSPDRYMQSDNVYLKFRENRTFELPIGRKTYRFEGREKKEVPRSVVEHKDFTDEMKKYFVVLEVE